MGSLSLKSPQCISQTIRSQNSCDFLVIQGLEGSVKLDIGDDLGQQCEGWRVTLENTNESGLRVKGRSMQWSGEERKETDLRDLRSNFPLVGGTRVPGILTTGDVPNQAGWSLGLTKEVSGRQRSYNDARFLPGLSSLPSPSFSIWLTRIWLKATVPLDTSPTSWKTKMSAEKEELASISEFTCSRLSASIDTRLNRLSNQKRDNGLSIDVLRWLRQSFTKKEKSIEQDGSCL